MDITRVGEVEIKGTKLSLWVLGSTGNWYARNAKGDDIAIGTSRDAVVQAARRKLAASKIKLELQASIVRRGQVFPIIITGIDGRNDDIRYRDEGRGRSGRISPYDAEEEVLARITPLQAKTYAKLVANLDLAQKNLKTFHEAHAFGGGRARVIEFVKQEIESLVEGQEGETDGAEETEE